MAAPTLDPTVISPASPVMFLVDFDQDVTINGTNFETGTDGTSGAFLIKVSLDKLELGVTQQCKAPTIKSVLVNKIVVTVPADKFSHVTNSTLPPFRPFDPGLTVTVTNPGALTAQQSYPMTFNT